MTWKIDLMSSGFCFVGKHPEKLRHFPDSTQSHWTSPCQCGENDQNRTYKIDYTTPASKTPSQKPTKITVFPCPWFIPFCLVNWVAPCPPCPWCRPGCSLIGGIWSSRWGRRRMILGAFTAVLNHWLEGRYPFSSAVIALSARLKLLN